MPKRTKADDQIVAARDALAAATKAVAAIVVDQVPGSAEMTETIDSAGRLAKILLRLVKLRGDVQSFVDDIEFHDDAE